MIEIIEHGAYYEEPSQPVSYRCKCCHCSCIFSFDITDTDIDYFVHDMSGRSPRIIDCPECGKTNRSHYWGRIDQIRSMIIESSNSL